MEKGKCRRSSLFLRALFTFSIFHFPFSILLLSGCNRHKTEIVLYTSVDEPYARPIIEEFEKQNDIFVRLVTDTEATKSVGLTERLRAEKANPQADVWWGNEPFNTINLAEEGLLQPYDSPAAGDVKAMYKDPQHRWAGNGLRARVIAVHVGDESPTPRGLADFVAPHAAMAFPTAGTTGGHVAALYVLWGDAKADEFFHHLHDNGIKLLGGNSIVADEVAAGNIRCGLSDNDDVASAQDNGGKIQAILPDQDSIGTLMLPTTVGLVTGSKQTAAAQKLIDYLLSAQVEQKMMEDKFVKWSVRHDNDVKAMQIDYTQVAHEMPRVIRRATDILEGRQ